MTIADLVDESAQVALVHAAQLHRLLRQAEAAGDTSMAECCTEMRHLVDDIATLRNAALLLAEAPARS